MTTSVGRYSFQAHHFQLAHDIDTLDNADSPLDDAEKNFPLFEPLNVKENEVPPSPSTTTKWTTTSRSTTSSCTQQQQQQQKTTLDLISDKLRNGSSTTCSVGFNSLLEARNQRNAAKSKFDTSEDLSYIGKTSSTTDGGRSGGPTWTAADHSKKLKPDVTASPIKGRNAGSTDGTRGWRIEDFATTERQCTKSGLNSFIAGLGTKRSDDTTVLCRAEDQKSSAVTSSPSRISRLEDMRIPARFIQGSYRSNQPVQSAIVAAIAASNAADDDMRLMSMDNCRLSAPLQPTASTPSPASSSSASAASVQTRVARQLPAIPRDAANRCSTQAKVERRPTSPKQVRAATMSLAEELQAAIRAAASDSSAMGSAAADLRKTMTLPLGVHFDNDDDSQSCRGCEVGIAQFLIHISELGTPDHVDPVNKYRDVVCDMAYGCVYRADSGHELDSDKNEDVGGSDADHCRLPSTISQSSSTSSGLMLRSIDERIEPDDVIAMTTTQLPLKKHHRRLDLDGNDDDDHVVSGTAVTSRIVECLPDVIAATVGAASRTDKDRDRHRDDLDDELGGCYDFLATGPSPGNKKSCIDRTTSLESSRSTSPARRSIHSSSSFSSSSLEYDLDELDATHRGCHRFVPRHPEELAIEISDPIYVELEEDDLWCEGINLRTRQRGIFPTAYATDLSILDDVPRSRKFFLKFLGSIEVAHHKGNDVLVQAINKLVMMRQAAWSTNPPPLCCIEINEYGIKMTERTKKKDSILTSEESTLAKKLARLLAKSMDTSSNIDTFFSLKNICFCGYHPKNERYLGIITKHPLAMRFACHIFLGEKSTRTVAEVIGDSFQRFYQEYLAVLNPTEDIYLE